MPRAALQDNSRVALRVRANDKATLMRAVALDGQTLKERVEQLEAALVRAALERHRWNHTRAADELGLSRVGLSNKLKRYGIGRQDEVQAA